MQDRATHPLLDWTPASGGYGFHSDELRRRLAVARIVQRALAFLEDIVEDATTMDCQATLSTAFTRRSFWESPVLLVCPSMSMDGIEFIFNQHAAELRRSMRTELKEKNNG